MAGSYLGAIGTTPTACPLSRAVSVSDQCRNPACGSEPQTQVTSSGTQPRASAAIGAPDSRDWHRIARLPEIRKLPRLLDRPKDAVVIDGLGGHRPAANERPEHEGRDVAPPPAWSLPAPSSNSRKMTPCRSCGLFKSGGVAAAATSRRPAPSSCACRDRDSARRGRSLVAGARRRRVRAARTERSARAAVGPT